MQCPLHPNQLHHDHDRREHVLQPHRHELRFPRAVLSSPSAITNMSYVSHDPHIHSPSESLSGCNMSPQCSINHSHSTNRESHRAHVSLSVSSTVPPTVSSSSSSSSSTSPTSPPLLPILFRPIGLSSSSTHGGEPFYSKSRIATLSTTTIFCLLFITVLYHSFPHYRQLYRYIAAHVREWRTAASFHVTHAMRVSIALSMALGTVLGVGVGLVSGLEPAVVIGVSAAMAMGCVFVMSFTILHGVNPLRAMSFAIFVSVCLPIGFGFGFGLGILIAIAFGLEDAEDIRDKAIHFITHFSDFVQVVIFFSMDVLKL